MDLSSILHTVLSESTVNGMSQSVGASASEVKNVLSNALPALLDGAGKQSLNADSAASFAAALQQHAKDDTSNPGAFMQNVDLEDGAKIIGHLLGGNTSATTNAIAKKTGVSAAATGNILAAAAPLLMSLLGQQSASNAKDDDSDGLLGNLLEKVDVGSLLASALGAGTSSSHNKKSGLAAILGALLGKK